MRARDLRHDQLVLMIEEIRQILWGVINEDGRVVDWNPEKEWDADTIELVSGVLSDRGIGPDSN